MIICSGVTSAVHLGLMVPAAGQLVSPTRLRFISNIRTGSLPGMIRSPTSSHAPRSAAMEIDASLSARERAIVLLMGHGLTNKMIARQLSIAPETVKSHAKRIFWKLEVQTRAQAVYRASALGLIGQ